MGVNGIGSRLEMTGVEVQLLLNAVLRTKYRGEFRDRLSPGVGVGEYDGSIRLARHTGAGDQEQRPDLDAEPTSAVIVVFDDFNAAIATGDPLVEGPVELVCRRGRLIVAQFAESRGIGLLQKQKIKAKGARPQ